MRAPPLPPHWLLLSLALLGRCPTASATSTTTSTAPASGSIQTLPSGLRLTNTLRGTCTQRTTSGDTLSVSYTGRLARTGEIFDSTSEHGRPFEFKLGAGRVIKGWDEGMQGLCIGEERTLDVSPDLAYGDDGVEGAVPGGAVLVFDVRLEDVLDISEDEREERVARFGAGEGAQEQEAEEGAMAVEGGGAGKSDGDGNGDGDGSEAEGKCRLLGPFSLVIQAALGALALLALVWKRWHEHPRRPVKIWLFDVSKQVLGSALLHLANLFMSLLSSSTLDVGAPANAAAAASAAASASASDGAKQMPNPCSFYLLNLAIDTTIGIPILFLLLRVLHQLFLLTPLARPPESLKSGNYGHPPRASWWAKQALVYFAALVGMKLIVFVLFQLLPWLAWVGDWALRWTAGRQGLQIAFVMLVFPVAMNALQYYIIDSFIKDHASEAEYERVDGTPGPLQTREGVRAGVTGADEEHSGLIGARHSDDDVAERSSLTLTEDVDGAKNLAGVSCDEEQDEPGLKEMEPVPIEEDRRVS